MPASATVVLVGLLHASWIQWLRLALQHTDMDYAMITAFLRKIFATAGR